MKKIIMLIASVIMLLAAASCSVAKGAADDEADSRIELVVAAAASFTDVSQDIADAYSALAPNVNLTFTYASSGSLQTQIEQGAPIDVFISASARQMDALEQQDLLLANSRVALLKNKVVLIAPSGSPLNLTSFDDLASDAVQTVAYGDPQIVPAGQYANELLTSLGIAYEVSRKANLATDVRQILTWVQSANVDCGIVYLTDALAGENVRIICEAPQGSTDKIVYPVAVMQSTQQPSAASDFIAFLQSQQSAAVFESYGFSMAD